MKKRGFTLIELLVVISIISLLSTVVMANLQTARTKAQEAAIKSDLQSIKTQAELSYSKTGDYSGVAAEVAPILAHINASGGTAQYVSSNDSPIFDGYKRYGVSVKFKSDNTKNWSVSSEGNMVIWDTGYNVSKTWSGAKTYCGDQGKRVPSIEELRGLWLAYGSVPDGFLTSDTYWSNNIYGSFSNAYILNMNNGNTGGESQNNSNLVRCVR